MATAKHGHCDFRTLLSPELRVDELLCPLIENNFAARLMAIAIGGGWAVKGVTVAGMEEGEIASDVIAIR